MNKLTESSFENYAIVPRDFNGKDIEVVLTENEPWFTARALGEGLEYENPRNAIMKIYYRHKDEIEDFSRVVTLGTGSTQTKTRVFNESGAYMILIFSKQPKAKDFRKWLVAVAKNIREKGYYIEKVEKGSTEWDLQIVEVMRTVLLRQQEHEKIQVEQENRIKQLEEKDRFIFVIPRTKRILRDEVDRIARQYFNNQHWKVWNPMKARFQVSRYEEFTEEDAQAILKGFAKEYPPKDNENNDIEVS